MLKDLFLTRVLTESRGFLWRGYFVCFKANRLNILHNFNSSGVFAYFCVLGDPLAETQVTEVLPQQLVLLLTEEFSFPLSHLIQLLRLSKLFLDMS